MSFADKFKRTTSSSFYLPQVDGLRFLAIIIVVVQMHIPNYINITYFDGKLLNSYGREFILEGINGVYLFFMISGFILALPFAKSYGLKESKMDLKNYYLRRLVRLEPPYLIALTLSFIASVWVLHKYSFTELIPHFFASVFYLHNIIYSNFSFVLPVAWTLEVEVQFYVLAPLFCCIFFVRSLLARLIFYFAVTISSVWYVYNYGKGIGNVISFLYFFYGGILLADLYANRIVVIKNERAGFLTGIAALLAFIFLLSDRNIWMFYAKCFCLLVLVHTVLTNRIMKMIFSPKWITIIGGMCYSIYLVHFAVLSFSGRFLLYCISNLSTPGYIPLYLLYFVLAILITSAVYFYFIEQPFMKLRTARFRKPETDESGR
jgi:peptidoglycan/LPS O-acetylase OafA/YrhL